MILYVYVWLSIVLYLLKEITNLCCDISLPLAVKIWTYLRVAEKEGIEPGDVDRPIDIILPTGAMGNIAGGYMAKKMGVPIGQLCAAVNINDITHRAFSRGEFHKSARMEKTLSDAINIQVVSTSKRCAFSSSVKDAALFYRFLIVDP